MAKGVKRSIYLYINGEEVENNIKAITAKMSKLINEQKKMTIGSNEYVAHAKRIKELRNVVDEHNQSLRSTQSQWDKLKGSLSSFGNIITGLTMGMQTVNQVIGSLKKMATDLAAMDDIYADVRKYTGMTLEEVKALNEEFKKLDTRTAREQLNKLAGDAGRLGIQSKEKILEFVDAADKINVALGEDLGEDAVKNIGKMAEMFGESDRMGLRAAMLSTGSAINTLAQTSSASEPYLMEFTARLSGAANQANITQAEVLGFASVLDQNMQKLEMSATALQNLIMKMMQNPAKFAKMAGVEVSKFSELLKTDANEAILTLIDSLNKKGGLSELAPIFKDMGLDGVRASGVISVLAGNIDKVREEQSKANKAYQEGTSVVDEYNIKNNNLQAQLEKARKRFQDMKLELGEKLYPILLKLTKTSTVFIKMLPKLIDFFVENKKIIIAMAAAYAALILIQSKKTILDKLELIQGKLKAAQMLTETISTNILALAKAKLSGNTLAAANAQKALKLAFASTPWGFVIVAIGAIVMALSQFIKNQNELSHSQKVWNEIATETTATYEKETIGVNKLIKAIHNENLSNEARQAAINELKQIIPGYNAMINDEGKIINENTQAIEDYLTSLKKKIKLQSVESQLKTAYEEEAKASKEAKQALKEYDEQAGIFFVDKLTKGWKSEKKGRIAAEAYKLVQELEAEFDKLYQETLTDPPDKTTPEEPKDYTNKNYEVDEKYADKYAAYLEKLAALREKYRLDKLSAFDKEIEETKKAYDEMIAMANEFSDKENAAKLEEEKWTSVEAIVNKHADAINKKVEEIYNKNKDNPLLQAVFGEAKKYDDLIADTDLLINSLKELNKTQNDPELAATIEELINRRAVLVSTRTKEVTEIIDKEAKKISTNLLNEHDKQIQSINERYDQEELIIKTAIEEKKKLGLDANSEEIKMLEELLAKLGIARKKDIDDANKTSIKGKLAKMLGIEEEDFEAILSEAQKFFSQLGSSTLQILENRNQKEIMDFKDSQSAQRKMLEDRLNSGVISQDQYNKQVSKLDEALDKKERELNRKQFNIKKAANIAEATITGIVAAIQSFENGGGYPWGLATMALSIATTGLQIGAIASEPNPYALGGFIKNEQIIRAGEAGPEWMASNRLLTDPATAPIIQALENYQRGKTNGFNALGFSTPSVSESTGSYTSTQTSGAMHTDDIEYKKSIIRLEKHMSDPKNRQSTINRELLLEFDNQETTLRNLANI